MIREVFRCETGVLWDIAQLKKMAHLEFEDLWPGVRIPVPALERPIDVSEEGGEEEKDHHHHHHLPSFGDLHLPHHMHGHANGHANGHASADGSSSRGTSFSKGTILESLDDDDKALLDARRSAQKAVQTKKSKFPSLKLSLKSKSKSNSMDEELDAHEHIHGYRIYNDGEQELHDAQSPLFDQLKASPIWWILEFFPVKGKKQIEEDLWKEFYL